MPKKSNDSIITETDHISIRCVADNKSELLEKAVLAGWKQCSGCSLFICQTCIQEFNTHSSLGCPGSFIGPNHEMILESIPVKELILMAENQSEPPLPITGILIHRSFFNILKSNQRGMEINNSINSFSKSIFLLKKEDWKTGAALVKRDRGKFITWEWLK